MSEFTPTKKRKVPEMYHSKPLANLQESQYNFYAGQNVCNIRDINLPNELNTRFQNLKMVSTAVYQDIYDMGCALMDLQIVVKTNNKWSISPNFFDYSAWISHENDVKANCELLAKLGHPLFQ